MKNIIINKDNFDCLHGLSCVENYLLYILKSELYAYKYLYYESFISFSDILQSFIDDEMEYAYFNKIKRIQNTAKYNELINICVYSDLKLIENHEYSCIMLKEEYVKLKYNKTFLRDDHYILLCPKSQKGEFYYLNDNPRNIGEVSVQELEKIYGGKIISFDIKKSISEEIKKDFLLYFIKNLDNYDKEVDLPISDIVKLQDILAVLKISRWRMYEFCSQYAKVGFLLEYLNDLEKKYANIEYMRLRNLIDTSKINDIIVKIYNNDCAQIKKIINLPEFQ